MTEFGKTVRLVDAHEADVKKWAGAMGALLSDGAADAIAARRKEAAALVAVLSTGDVGAKVAKFKARAAEPEETRAYSAAMCEKVNNFARRVEAIIASIDADVVAPLAAWEAAAAERAAVVLRIQNSLDATVAEETTARGFITWEAIDGGFLEGLAVEREWAHCASEAWDEFTAELCRREKRAAEKERKKAKKRAQQQDMREANERKVRREREAQAQQRLDDLHRSLLIVEHKETKARAALTAEYYETRPTPPAILTQQQQQQGGRRSPTVRTTPPRGRRSPSPSADTNAARPVAASFAQLPPAVVDLEYDVSAIPKSAQVELVNAPHRVGIEMFRCLLRLRDLPLQPAFDLPEELLTDHKAKKRYMANRAPAQAGKAAVHFDPQGQAQVGVDDDGDDDDDALMGLEGDEEDSGSDAEDPLALNYYPVETYSDSDDEDESYNTLPATVPNLAFLRPLHTQCVVVFMSVGGSFAGGVFMAGDCVVHTTFHRYICRKKQGGRQSNHDGRSDTVGSQMRARHELRFKELVAQVLHTWRVPLAHATAIFLNAPGAVNKQPFFSPMPLPPSTRGTPFAMSKKDPRILPVPMSTHKPSFTEVKRVYEAMTTCQYAHTE